MPTIIPQAMSPPSSRGNFPRYSTSNVKGLNVDTGGFDELNRVSVHLHQDGQEDMHCMHATKLQALAQGWLTHGQKISAVASPTSTKADSLSGKMATRQDDASGATIRSYEDDSSASHVHDRAPKFGNVNCGEDEDFETDEYDYETVSEDEIDIVSQATDVLEIVEVDDAYDDVEIVEEEIFIDDVHEGVDIAGEILGVEETGMSGDRESRLDIKPRELQHPLVNSSRINRSTLMKNVGTIHSIRWSTSDLTDSEDMERWGSTTLQALARGFLVRRESKRRLSEIDWLTSIFEEEHTFLAPECTDRKCDLSKIQALARGFLVRRDSKRRASEVDWLVNTFSAFAAKVDSSFEEDDSPSNAGDDECRERTVGIEVQAQVCGGSVGSLTTDSESRHSTPLCEYSVVLANSSPPFEICLPSDFETRTGKVAVFPDSLIECHTVGEVVLAMKCGTEQDRKNKSAVVLQSVARGFFCRTTHRSMLTMNRLKLRRFMDTHVHPDNHVPTLTASQLASCLPPSMPSRLTSAPFIPKKKGSFQNPSSALDMPAPSKAAVPTTRKSFDEIRRFFAQSTNQCGKTPSTFASRQAVARQDLEKRECIRIQALVRGHICRNKAATMEGRCESVIFSWPSKLSHVPDQSPNLCLPKYKSKKNTDQVVTKTNATGCIKLDFVEQDEPEFTTRNKKNQHFATHNRSAASCSKMKPGLVVTHVHPSGSPKKRLVSPVFPVSKGPKQSMGDTVSMHAVVSSATTTKSASVTDSRSDACNRRSGMVGKRADGSAVERGAALETAMTSIHTTTTVQPLNRRPPLSPTVGATTIMTPATFISEAAANNVVAGGGGGGQIKVTVINPTNHQPPPVPRASVRHRPFPIALTHTDNNSKDIALSPTSPRTEMREAHRDLKNSPQYPRRPSMTTSSLLVTTKSCDETDASSQGRLYQYDPEDPFDDDMTVKSVHKALASSPFSSRRQSCTVPLYQSWNTFDLSSTGNSNSSKTTTQSIPVRRSSCPGVPPIHDSGTSISPTSKAMTQLSRNSSSSNTGVVVAVGNNGKRVGSHVSHNTPQNKNCSSNNNNKAKNRMIQRVLNPTTAKISTIPASPKVRCNSFCNSRVPPPAATTSSNSKNRDDTVSITSMSIQERIKLFQK
jgi:hypothetical protein